jgi:hypothetical protein
MAITILHEFSHAAVALALGVRSTLFNYFADLDLTAEQAASNLPALIRVAGPSVCLVAGLLSLFAYKRLRNSAVELPLLFLSVFGIGTFFGNMMSTAFVGDFSGIAITLGPNMTIRYVLSAVGAIAACAVHFWIGRELIQWAPSGIGRVTAAIGVVVLPVVLGTAIVILVNQPAASANVRIAEASLWLFAVVGALTKTPDPGTKREIRLLHWGDMAFTLLAALVVRLMVRGISFEP